MKDLIKSLMPMKWYFALVAVLLGWLAYANLNGERIWASDNQQQWNASGPGTQYGIANHK